MMDFREAIIGYTGIMVEYSRYNYSLANVPDILNTPKRDPKTFLIEHQSRQINLNALIPQTNKAADSFFKYLKRMAAIN